MERNIDHKINVHRDCLARSRDGNGRGRAELLGQRAERGQKWIEMYSKQKKIDFRKI